MLYKLNFRQPSASRLEPIPFSGLSALGKLEKDLENILADHLLDVLFEDEPLMPIFRERPYQPEADLYALNQEGDLIIFELKRGTVGNEAVHQLLRYAQDAGQWTFKELQRKFAVYSREFESEDNNLSTAHSEAFKLEHPLQPSEFNRRQHLWLIGSAADAKLIDAVEYWRQQGILMRFAPYRIYQVAGDHYFEFFSAPYDRHSNPADVKGVLFDTNQAYNADSVWDMIENKRIAAYGGAKDTVEYLNPRDIVFYSHRGEGIIAAAEVIGPTKQDGSEQKYRSVKFLTSVPDRQHDIRRSMSFPQVSEVTGKRFFWARTAKVPYLTSEEAKALLQELRNVLSQRST